MTEQRARKTEQPKDGQAARRPILRSLPPLPLPPPPAGPAPRSTRDTSSALKSDVGAPNAFPLPPLNSGLSEAIPLRPEVGTGVLAADPLVQQALVGMMAPKETSVVRLLSKVRQAGGETKARFGRLIEHVRLLYQLRLVVQGEQLKQKARFDQARLNKWVVSSYKALGFAVLTVIVLALISYMGQNVFYWFSSSWIEPTVIAPTDERVLTLSTKLAEQQTQRDKLQAELADADRIIAMHEGFLSEAKKAIEDELTDRKGELTKLMALGKSLSSTRAEVRNNGRAYSAMSKKRLALEYRSHLIDRETAVSGNMQLSQIAQGNLSLAEKGVELSKRTADLSRETESLQAILSAQPATKHSYDVLRIMQDLKRSELELAKARDNRGVVAKSLERWDHMIATIVDSPYLRAAQRKDTIAFVPYDNISKAKAGASVYACAAGPLFCRNVGKVVAVLAGEMSAKHPTHNTQLRGQSVQVELSDAKAAEHAVLFVGSRPVLF
jgi:hypothetical protein